MAPSALLDRLTSLRRELGRLLGTPAPVDTDPRETEGWLAAAGAARAEGRSGAALELYRRVLRRRATDRAALEGLRDTCLAAGHFQDAVDAQQRLLAAASPGERAEEAERLASLHYEWARADLDQGRPAAAIPRLRSALRTARAFVPAAVTLGDALLLAGDAREAVRTWERSLEHEPSLPVLARLERAHRDQGRPTRMIALYRQAVERAPDDIALAVALGRVYLELEMLDEAADQLEKVEVRAPNLPAVHAYLAAVFERRGEWREACAEYRRVLQLARAWDWPHGCDHCGSTVAGWQDRCPACRRWNSLRPTQS
jgi:lipopolysaccharide biosynthesis regulator YciM